MQKCRSAADKKKTIVLILNIGEGFATIVPSFWVRLRQFNKSEILKFENHLISSSASNKTVLTGALFVCPKLTIGSTFPYKNSANPIGINIFKMLFQLISLK